MLHQAEGAHLVGVILGTLQAPGLACCATLQVLPAQGTHGKHCGTSDLDVDAICMASLLAEVAVLEG